MSNRRLRLVVVAVAIPLGSLVLLSGCPKSEERASAPWVQQQARTEEEYWRSQEEEYWRGQGYTSAPVVQGRRVTPEEWEYSKKLGRQAREQWDQTRDALQKAEADRFTKQMEQSPKQREPIAARFNELLKRGELTAAEYYNRQRKKERMEQSFSDLADRFNRGKITGSQYQQGLDSYLRERERFEELPPLRIPGRITGPEAVAILEDARRPPGRTD